MVGLKDHLKDPLYANWVKNTRALNIVNAVLKPYVYDEVIKIHRSIISKCPDGVTCGSCSWRKAPLCPNNFCNIIKKEIEENHRYGVPSFDNTNARDWKSDAWEVAKCFMPISRGYRECTSSDADFSAIVNIVINCKAFDKLVLCDLGQKQNIFSEARGMRNYLMHSDEQKVSECAIESNLDLLICILNDFKKTPPKSPETIDKITELKADKITTEDVIDAQTQLLLRKGATTEYVDDEIAKLRKEIEEDESIWKAPQHKLIDKFVKGCKHALVKIMESQIDMVRPSRRPHPEWNLCEFLDKIELDSDVKSLSQLHWDLLYPDDGSTPDINTWDLFLLCHILSIESIFQLDNNLKTYIKEIKRIRDKIISNPDKLVEEDLKVLTDFLEEPLKTEIINVYGGEDIKDNAVKLHSVLIFWRQEEINMEHEQINTNTLKQNKEVVARVDVLENNVLQIFDLLRDRTEIGSLPEGYGQGIESHIKLKPKHCDKKEEEQVQDNMTTKDEGVNISTANGGMREFCEQMNLKTAQALKGSIILKVTCKSIKDLVRFWDSCTDGRALRALSKVRDDYRKFLGCDTLDFDIVLSKKEVNRCVDYLVDRLSSSIPDISVLEKALDTQPLLEIVPEKGCSVDDRGSKLGDIALLTGESDREVLEDAQQVGKEGTTLGEILKQTRVSLEEVHDVSEDVHDVPEEIRNVPEEMHDVPEEIRDVPEEMHDVPEEKRDVPKEMHDVPEEIHDVPGGRKGLILEEDRPGIALETRITSFGDRRMEEMKQFEQEPEKSSGTLKQTLVSLEKLHGVSEEVHDEPARRLSRTDTLMKGAKYGEENATRLVKFLEEIAENFEEGKISVIKPYLVQLIKHSKERDKEAFDEVIMDFTEATKFRSGISVSLMKQAFRGFRMILTEPEFGDLVAAKVEAIEKQEGIMGGVESKAWQIDPKISAEDIQVGDKMAKEPSKTSDTVHGKPAQRAGTSKGLEYYETEKGVSPGSKLSPGVTVTGVSDFSKPDPLKSKMAELTTLDIETKSMESMSFKQKPGSPGSVEATETTPAPKS